MNHKTAILPQQYKTASEQELRNRIAEKRQLLGKRLIILTHHYQRLEIVEVGDYAGDSYQLAKIAARSPDAEYIAFCGVHFMAEAANILGRPDQKVYLPNPTAGCPMADMAPSEQVYEAWDQINESLGKGSVVPISYMNSSAELKAFTGKNGGLICTSSNADAAFRWAYRRFERVFFFPDQHLGRYTAKKFGVPSEQIVLFNPRKPLGGLSLETLKNSRVILWMGHCHVHAKFQPDQIDEWRAKEPNIKIVVHPECDEAVVNKADAVGSTSFIVNFVESAPSGSTIAIGTELNLIHRLAVKNPDKKIFELSGNSCAICSNMFRTSLADLCFTLENFDIANRIIVPDDIKHDAKLALDRMLEIGN